MCGTCPCTSTLFSLQVSYEFYDTDVSRDVLHVWQGLAVHDRLTFFTPCHITRKKEDQPAVHCSCCCCSAAGDAATTPAAEQLFRYPEYVDLYTTVETWLPGAHYDCGRQNFVFLRQVSTDYPAGGLTGSQEITLLVHGLQHRAVQYV